MVYRYQGKSLFNDHPTVQHLHTFGVWCLQILVYVNCISMKVKKEICMCACLRVRVLWGAGEGQLSFNHVAFVKLSLCSMWQQALG